MANHKNILAVKEANASLPDAAKLCAQCGDRLDIYSGNDDLILPTLSLGGKGVISVLSNILPKETSTICKLWFDGKVKEAQSLQLRLLPLINALFIEVNPIPIKALLSHLGFCNEEYRLPLCQMNEEKKNELIKTFESFQFT
jgi:4-hydroxy-tetrahydrodipicolinate synthase